MKNDLNYPLVRNALTGRTRLQFFTVGESLTDQSQADDCDVNRILARYQKTGVLEHLNRFEGSYGDFLDVPSDYQSAIEQVRAADLAFADLPSTVRRRFGNSVSDFLHFVSDAGNVDEMRTLGLLRESDNLIEPHSRPVEAPPSASGPKNASGSADASKAL